MRFNIVTILLTVCLLFAGGSAIDSSAKTNDSDAEENILLKPNLKVLHIGNSFTFDAVSYLPLIIEGTGSDVSDLCIYRTMMAGGSFKTWYDTYNDIDTWLDYRVDKVCGGIDANISTGAGNAGDGTLFRKALTGEQWDIIFIQPASTYSPYYEQWGGDGPGGYLNELLSVIKEQQPQATIGLMLVHSAASTYAGNAEGSSLLRWEKIVQSVDTCCAEHGIDLVVPYGTAVQNLRASSLNNEQDLTADGLHCEYGLTRYVASCCYYQTIIAPRSGVSVLEDKTRINAAYIKADSPVISVDDSTSVIAQKAAIMAVNDWHTCNNPEEHENPDGPVPGDVNGDGIVDVADIASVVSAMAGDLSVSKDKANVNGDAAVDVADIAAIITIMAGGDI